jgi:DNA-binding winged helix-turn-helix (wHTH) protein
VSRRRKHAGGERRSPAAVVLEPYANYLRKLAKAYGLASHESAPGLLQAAEILTAARAVAVDLPELAPDTVDLLRAAVLELKNAADVVRELAADVASAVAVAGGEGGVNFDSTIERLERDREKTARARGELPPLLRDLEPPGVDLPPHKLEPRPNGRPAVVHMQGESKPGVFKHGPAKVSVQVHGVALVDDEDFGRMQLSRMELSMLQVLAQRSPEPTTKEQLAILTRYSGRSGPFAQALGKLRRLELVGGNADLLFATVPGIERARPFESMPKGAELRSWWSRRLGRAEARILDALVEAYPHELERDELAARTRYSGRSGPFAQALAKLRRLDLVKGLRASPVLMEDS